MRQLPIEENDRTASVMAYVEHGETVEVTRQGRVVLVIYADSCAIVKRPSTCVVGQPR